MATAKKVKEPTLRGLKYRATRRKNMLEALKHDQAPKLSPTTRKALKAVHMTNAHLLATVLTRITLDVLTGKAGPV